MGTEGDGQTAQAKHTAKIQKWNQLEKGPEMAVSPETSEFESRDSWKPI